MTNPSEEELLKGLKQKRKRTPKDALEPTKKQKKKSGKPKELEEDHQPEVSLEQFVKEMHGQADQPQNGMPSLDSIKTMFQTKSAAVRFLIHEGHAVKDIAKHLGMKYQHVRNVSLQTLKRGPNEDWRRPSNSNQNQSQIRQNSVEFSKDLDGDGEKEQNHG